MAAIKAAKAATGRVSFSLVESGWKVKQGASIEALTTSKSYEEFLNLQARDLRRAGQTGTNQHLGHRGRAVIILHVVSLPVDTNSW